MLMLVGFRSGLHRKSNVIAAGSLLAAEQSYGECHVVVRRMNSNPIEVFNIHVVKPSCSGRKFTWGKETR